MADKPAYSPERLLQSKIPGKLKQDSLERIWRFEGVDLL